MFCVRTFTYVPNFDRKEFYGLRFIVFINYFDFSTIKFIAIKATDNGYFILMGQFDLTRLETFYSVLSKEILMQMRN